jgi:hypothetical protein
VVALCGSDGECDLGCAEHAVLRDEPLTEQIVDGFGPSPSGEDPFDAVAFAIVPATRPAVEAIVGSDDRDSRSARRRMHPIVPDLARFSLI